MDMSQGAGIHDHFIGEHIFPGAHFAFVDFVVSHPANAPEIIESHLQQKRDEFWDTAPAFEGRQEIWRALRSAAEAEERGDHELAQAIIDSADVVLPTGTLSECYDELGNRYQLPIFVLSRPINLEPDGGAVSSSSGSPLCEGDATDQVRLQEPPPNLADCEGVTVVNLSSPHFQPPLHHSSNSVQTPSVSSRTPRGDGAFRRLSRLFRPGRRRIHTLGKKARRKRHLSWSAKRCSNQAFVLHMRLSTGEDYAFPVTDSQSVVEVKRQLSSLTGWPPDRQRWFCCGVALRDGLMIADFPPSVAPPLSFVVQVVVHSPLEPENTWSQIRRVRP